MKVLAALCLVAGGVFSLTTLRAINGKWDSFGEFAAVTAGLNIFVALLAYFLFRRNASSDLTYYRVGLIIAYIAGLGCGGYLYYY